MNAYRIDRDDPRYPKRVTGLLGDDSPRVLHLVGDSQILQQVHLGLICSVSCPGSVVIKTFDAIRDLRDAGIVVTGGFHSPMERECLDFLLRGEQPVVLCSACGTEGISLDQQQQEALDRRRLLVLSIFSSEIVRATPEVALRRNEFVAALTNALFVPHAAPGGKAEATAKHAVARGQNVLTFDDDENARLIALGVKPVGVRQLVRGVIEVLGRPSPRY